MKNKEKVTVGIIVVLIIGIIACVAVLLGKTQTKKVEKAMITWIDDDTFINGFPLAHDLAEDMNIHISFACITDKVTKETLLDLIQYQKEGHHITTHSASHDNINVWGSNNSEEDFNVKAAEEDLIRSLDFLKDAGFKDYDYFVTPGGIEFPEVINLTKKYCSALIGAGYSGDINMGSNIDKYKLERVFISKNKFDDVKHYTDYIDEAIANKGWLIFGTHSSNGDEWDADLVRAILQYAIDHQVEILPFNEAYKELGYK